MKTLYFCRHGLTVYGIEGKWAGSTDVPLAPEGRKQAQQAASEAKELGIDYIMTSSLSRATDTAQIINEVLKLPNDRILVSDLLVERHFGELEGTPHKPEKTDFTKVKDLEPLEELFERARQTVKYLESLDADTILVVSHGSFGRALRTVLHPDIPFDTSEQFQNAKIVKLY